MRKFFLISLAAVMSLTVSCKKESDPGKADLIFPKKDEACITGNVVSDTENSIKFSWKASENTDTYTLTIKNLLNGEIITHITGGTILDVQLQRNTPYSWTVISQSTSNKTAISDTWKFYNSGPGVLSYTPYPAEIVSPVMGEKVNASTSKVSLDWTGSDTDNDIVSYDVYFGNKSVPALLKANNTDSKLDEVSVSGSGTYYWKVITKDSKGNTSDSGVYQFSIN